MKPWSYQRWTLGLEPWGGVLALALVGCGGADRGRPEAVDDGVPGPDVEDLGSGPFRCDQGSDLELALLDDFETGAANGSFYTNNEVCDLCQALIDLRVGGYATGASLNRAANAAAALAADPDSEDLREAVRVELRRLIEHLQVWIEQPVKEPNFALQVGPATTYQKRFRELLASDLDAADIEDLLALVNNPTNGIGDAQSDWGEIQVYVQDQMEPCRAACEVTQTPTPVFTKPVTASRIPNTRCGSVYALDIKAGPLTNWGGTLGTSFGPPIDGTEWDGIAFWARVGTGSRTPIRIEVSDKFTSEKYEDPNNDDKPICNPTKTEDTVRTGCDKFGINLQLGYDWKLYTVPFDELRQKGWGLRAPYFDVGALRGMSFLFERGSWDIWVDDVALYRRKP